ncbi:response regulator [Flagellimonas olearia]|uniref:Transcriptional regulator n=1 Tax=Flagellimonas olearia TaxID=552546 RepID=A0A444VI68_9FLAO|nr:response regulator [Allomuricauda olearia]RYC50459.1 transcriptional regulator [Allomuricauda olearia]
MSQLQSACIVDDDPIHLFGMKVLMKRLDFSNEVLVFQNGQEAIDGLLDRLGAGKPLPSVIFLDLNMPIKDGWGFLDDFVKIPHHNREKVTIYVVSSSIHPHDQERAKNYEVVGNYIIKPLNEQELKQVLIAKN